MMTDARTAIFASIRENLAASRPFDAEHAEHVSTITSPQKIFTSDETDAVDLFRENLELVGAKCYIVEDEGRAAHCLSEIIDKLPTSSTVISNSELVAKVAGLTEIEAQQNVPTDKLFASDIGISSAQFAIAETGTLVLCSAAETNRLVSLVPPVHICLLPADSIRHTMAEILSEIDTERDRAVTFITGASRTSDIELTLAIGVHGPRELHVIVIRQDGRATAA